MDTSSTSGIVPGSDQPAVHGANGDTDRPGRNMPTTTPQTPPRKATTDRLVETFLNLGKADDRNSTRIRATLDSSACPPSTRTVKQGISATGPLADPTKAAVRRARAQARANAMPGDVASSIPTETGSQRQGRTARSSASSSQLPAASKPAWHGSRSNQGGQRFVPASSAPGEYGVGHGQGVRRRNRGPGSRGESRSVTRQGQVPAPTRRDRAFPASEGDSSSGPREENLTVQEPASRGALARYSLLSIVFITVGLAVRYLWRQLAGLAGAWLILSSAKRWTGNRAQASTLGSRRTEEASEAPECEGSARAPAVPEGDAAPSAASEAEHEGPLERIGAAVVSALTGDKDSSAEDVDFGGAFGGAPPQMRRFWEDAGAECTFVVRGRHYMSDKQKVPAGPALMKLVHVDFFALPSEVFHIASKGRCRDRISRFKKSFEDKGRTPSFLFILNIILPGNPVVSSVMYWALQETDEGVEGDDEGVRSRDVFMRMLTRYAEVPGSGLRGLEGVTTAVETDPSSDETRSQQLADASAASGSDGSGIGSPEGSRPDNSSNSFNSRSPSSPVDEVEGAKSSAKGVGSLVPGLDEKRSDPRQDGVGLLPPDDFRNQRFKLIPSIVSGPFIVRKAVGNKPALLGRKLHQRYFRGAGYVETDVDVGSSIVAEKVVSLCRGYARSLTVELGVCLEGRCQEELPEKCAGVIRLVNLDLDGAEPLEEPTSSEVIRAEDSQAKDATSLLRDEKPPLARDQRKHEGTEVLSDPVDKEADPKLLAVS